MESSFDRKTHGEESHDWVCAYLPVHLLVYDKISQGMSVGYP